LAKLKKIPEEVLILSLENVGPLFSIKTKKKGKKILQIPNPIYSIEKRFSISSNWIIKNSSKHNSTFFLQNFVNELLDSSDNQGFSKKQQQELNKLVVLNRSSL
jgi:ribosomal protein S7